MLVSWTITKLSTTADHYTNFQCKYGPGFSLYISGFEIIANSVPNKCVNRFFVKCRATPTHTKVRLVFGLDCDARHHQGE